MEHLGDITQIDGGEIEPVDVITFGSPCQDLSIAGKRAGLSGERSNLCWLYKGCEDCALYGTNECEEAKGK